MRFRVGSGAATPLQALALRWYPDPDFAGDAAANSVRGVLRLLRKRSLLMLEGEQPEGRLDLGRKRKRKDEDASDLTTFRLHDLVRAYLRAKVGADGLRSSQVALLVLYRKRSSVPGLWASLPRDGYIHENLLYHIKEAEGADGEDAAALLAELRPLHEDIGSEASVDFRTQTRTLRKHALLSTKLDLDKQRWLQLNASKHWEERYDAVSMAVGLWPQLMGQQDVLEQLQCRIVDLDERVAVRASKTCELLQPGLDQAAVATIAAKLEDSEHAVRCAAVLALGRLDAAVLQKHARAVAARLEDEHDCVRDAAMKTLGQLEEYVPAIAVAKLRDSDRSVRVAALRNLAAFGEATLVAHVSAIAAKLEDSHEGVWKAAALTLGQLPLGAYATHAAAVLAKLEDSDKDVRVATVLARNLRGGANGAAALVAFLNKIKVANLKCATTHERSVSYQRPGYGLGLPLTR